MKTNCWERLNCGREPGGAKAEEMGVCPAATEWRLDGIHGGKNAGRACWAVSGTSNDGYTQGTFACGYTACAECDFFREVQKEEKENLIVSSELRKLLIGDSQEVKEQ